MTLAQLTAKAPAATEAENTALRQALSNNYPANFDAFDIVRLIIYRRAIRAGQLFSDGGPLGSKLPGNVMVDLGKPW